MSDAKPLQDTIPDPSPNTIKDWTTLYGIRFVGPALHVPTPIVPRRRRANSEPAMSASMKLDMAMTFGIVFSSFDSDEDTTVEITITKTAS